MYGFKLIFHLIQFRTHMFLENKIAENWSKFMILEIKIGLCMHKNFFDFNLRQMNIWDGHKY